MRAIYNSCSLKPKAKKETKVKKEKKVNKKEKFIIYVTETVVKGYEILAETAEGAEDIFDSKNANNEELKLVYEKTLDYSVDVQ
jgi:hypothetical protein